MRKAPTNQTQKNEAQRMSKTIRARKAAYKTVHEDEKRKTIKKEMRTLIRRVAIHNADLKMTKLNIKQKGNIILPTRLRIG